MYQKRLTPDQAFQHTKQYCAYQERSHSEVREKLFSFGLSRIDVDKIVSQLIEEDSLNEERFARAFARGKFRMKQWGKVKIRYELKQKRVSDYCIRKGLTEIDDDEYNAILSKLTEQKMKLLRGEKNIFIKKRKLFDYLLQKGYEKDLISEIIKEQTAE